MQVVVHRIHVEYSTYLESYEWLGPMSHKRSVEVRSDLSRCVARPDRNVPMFHHVIVEWPGSDPPETI